jgi:hypothetical protein
MSLKLKAIIHDIVRETLNSEILFRIEITVEKNFSYIPLEITGELISDKIRISNLVHKIRLDSNKGLAHNKNLEIETHSDFYDVIATLSKEAIEHIQNVREKDSYKDVLLTLDIKLKYLTSTVYCESNPQKLIGKDDYLLRSNYHSFSPERIEILSSDWLNKYLSVFYKQRYLVLEIPKHQLSNGNSLLHKKVEKAMVIIPKMERKLSLGEWSEVIKEARPLIELFKIDYSHNRKSKENTESNNSNDYGIIQENQETEFKNLFRNSNYTEPAISSLTDALQHLFHFCSKFSHSIDNRQQDIINPDIIASKEDAYLIYALCSNFVNLIAKKLDRSSVK